MNRLRERITHIRMTDQGCMLRAYSRDIVAAVAASREVSTFIPALAYTFAQQSGRGRGRARGARRRRSRKYSLYKLIRLNFDLVTGFSLVPLQLFSMFGMLVSALALVAVRRSSSSSGWFTCTRSDALAVFWDRDILAFFLIGMVLFGLGLIGEYVGRIYQQVRARPRYMIRAVLERRPAPTSARAEPARRALAKGVPARSARR